MYRNLLSLIVSVFIALNLGSGPAHAQESQWKTSLIEVEDRTATTPIVLNVLEESWSPNPQNFALEVDNIDVSSLVEIEETQISYTPAEPLNAGIHAVRIYEITSEGDYVERGFWQFIVNSGGGAVAGGGEGSDGSGETHVEASMDNSIEISQRLFDKNISSSVSDDTFVSGAGSGNLNIANGNWSLTASGNYFIESEDRVSVTGNEFDLGEYSIAFQHNGSTISSGATLGHQDIGVESLAMTSFNRRGVSLNIGGATERWKVTGFSLSSDSLAGGDDITGQKEESGYVAGGAAMGRPLWDENAKIELTGLYFTSQGGELDFGSSGGLVTSTAPKGEGAAVIADSYWWQDRIRVRGEYAYSNMDLDGDESLGKDGADANAVDLSYVAIRDDGQSETPVSLTIGGRWEKVDTFYYSLANQGLAVDRNAFSAFANMYVGAFSLNAYSGYESNNTADLQDVATDEVISAGFDGNYTFTINREEPDDLAWLGTPFFGFGASIFDADRKKTPVGFLGDGTDNTTLNYYINFGSSYERWNWQLGYNRREFDDDTDVSSDTADETIDLSAYWTVSDSLNLSAGTSLNRFEQKADGERSYNVSGNLGLQAILIPDTLTTNISYNMNLSSGSGDSPDKHILSGEMEWTFISPEVNKPGVALAFRGAMEKDDGNSDNSLDDTKYEGFLVLRIKAPVAY